MRIGADRCHIEACIYFVSMMCFLGSSFEYIFFSFCFSFTSLRLRPLKYRDGTRVKLEILGNQGKQLTQVHILVITYKELLS